jgi:hypothetical protein
LSTFYCLLSVSRPLSTEITCFLLFSRERKFKSCEVFCLTLPCLSSYLLVPGNYLHVANPTLVHATNFYAVWISIITVLPRPLQLSLHLPTIQLAVLFLSTRVCQTFLLLSPIPLRNQLFSQKSLLPGTDQLHRRTPRYKRRRIRKSQHHFPPPRNI